MGFTHRQLGDEEEARRHFQSALEISEKIFLEAQSSSGRAPGIRALALGYLGRSDEAIQLARTLPSGQRSDDRYTGPREGENKAHVLTAAGDVEGAVAQLERMLETPYIYAITVWDLRLDPVWDPLREHPEFRALVAEDG